MIIEAAADGSSLGNPGPTGWGWFVDAGCWASGGWPRGTNNMGELMAVLDLLRQSASRTEDLRVHCDSRYVIDAVTKWIPGWKRRGWRKADGSPVLNLDLIQPIDELMQARRAAGRRVEFEWVKGHAGHPLNEAADRLANAAAAAYQAGRLPDPGPGFGDGPAGPVPPQGQLDLFAAAETSTETSTEASDEQVVIDLERSLLTSAVRASRRTLDALLHPNWCEFGSSGRVLERSEVLAGLGPTDAELQVHEVTRLSEDVILLLWRAVSSERTSLRSSLWVRTQGRWQQRFHQGTVAP